jgi:DNA replication protein DnaC
LDAVSGSSLLGSAAFISFVKESCLVGRVPDKNLPALKQLADRLSIHVKKKDIILIGNPGVGKSVRAKTMAYAATQQGFKVLFTTAGDFGMVLNRR